MTEKAKEIKELINKCYLGKELENAFTEAFEGSGQKITDEMYEMYVYVLDAEGTEKLEALANQYLILKEVSDNNFSKFKEVFEQIPEHKREQVLEALKLYNEACMAVEGNAND